MLAHDVATNRLNTSNPFDLVDIGVACMLYVGDNSCVRLHEHRVWKTALKFVMDNRDVRDSVIRSVFTEFGDAFRETSLHVESLFVLAFRTATQPGKHLRHLVEQHKTEQRLPAWCAATVLMIGRPHACLGRFDTLCESMRTAGNVVMGQQVKTEWAANRFTNLPGNAIVMPPAYVGQDFIFGAISGGCKCTTSGNGVVSDDESKKNQQVRTQWRGNFSL